ncbi:LPP leucine zipper domain-containing protein [Parashewanella tropica]|uniref:LPP leucine zipper domain-containing protein n=1 Tax=Parashewanella tropica TaxID=2547970 RepID=UPI0014780B54|nr:LPP leucine zipper domain-containing protein [Parashewanella tropica]
MKKLLIISALGLTCLLSGCVSNAELQAHINTTNQKLDQLSSQVNDMKSQHEQMMNSIKRNKQAAERANDRLNNLARNYRK